MKARYRNTSSVQRARAIDLNRPGDSYRPYLRLGSARFQTKNRFAFLHQVETIARNCFQIRRIRFQPIDFARLTCEQSFLFVH